MAFAATTTVLLFLHRKAAEAAAQARRPGGPAAGASPFVERLGRAVQLLELQLLIAVTAAVAYGRVYLGYHSPGQVLAGLAMGAAAAAAWWRLTLAICRRWVTPLLRLPPLRALHFRNTLDQAQVHAREAALCAPHAD